jgi:hypothetical protein
MYKSLYKPSIPKSTDYGLSPTTPLYGGIYEIFYLEYLSLLKHNGKPIKIRKKGRIEVEFNERMLEDSSITGVNSYQILNEYNKEITTIYVFEKSDYEKLKPPTGFTFPYSIDK